MTNTHTSAGFRVRVPAFLAGRRDFLPNRSGDLRELYAHSLAMHTEPRHRAPGDASRAPDPLTDYVSPRRTAEEQTPALVETCNFFAVPVPTSARTLPGFPENTETTAIDIRALIAQQDEPGGEATAR